MKTYKVISPYVERDDEGNPIGYAKQGGTVELDAVDGERLTTAKCVEEVEARVIKTPENRGKRGNNKNSKRVNSRASKSK